MLVWGCGSENGSNKREEAEFQKKLNEAKEVAEKIRTGDIFDEEAIIREKLLNPVNVCTFSADFSALDFGPEPEFRGDGDSAIYSDKTGTIHYFYFRDRRKYKMGTDGRNPSFGMFLQDESKMKYIYEQFRLKPNSWEGENVGIVMNTEGTWMNEPIRVTDRPGTYPFLTNQDQTIIYKIGDKYFQLDEKLQEQEIPKAEYERLRDSRFSFEHRWKVVTSYRNIEGVWVTDLEEKNWVQLRDIKSVTVTKIIPKKYYIYAYSPESAGVCMIKFGDVQQYTLELPAGTTAVQGEFFEIYDNEVNPISKEVIGPDKTAFKGILRVTSVVGNKVVCEYQTKLFGQGIFAGYSAISSTNPSLIGKVL